MASSKETAEKILAHLQDRKGRTAQLGNAVASLQRRDFDSAVAEIANLIDGKPAVVEAAPEPPKPVGRPPKPESQAGGQTRN